MTVRSSRWQAALLLLVALLLRVPLFGDPVIHSDEQFYLLVGDRLLHGAWPYLDIWDRKPPGLFLLYAAIRLVGGLGIVQYQMVASLAAAATAIVIGRIAARVSDGAVAPLFAGSVYLVWLMLFDGAGGQAPVFYNLPIAGAGLLTLDALAGKPIAPRAAAAMLLVGLALQLKYSCIFEGIAFGLALLWRLHRSGGRARALIGYGALWIALALLPTLVAWGIYAAQGASSAFVHANFLSIFQRTAAETSTPAGVKLLGTAASLAPLLYLALTGSGERPVRRYLLGWTIVALAGAWLVGSDSHYVLPVLVPLSACAAASTSWRARIVVLIGGAAAAMLVTVSHVERRGDAPQIAQAMAVVRPNLRADPQDCLFVFGSEPILYHLARTCLPSRFLFRSHLTQNREAGAIGVDPVAEVARILRNTPGVIVVREPRANSSTATLALVRQAVTTRYTLVGRVRIGSSYHCIYAVRPRTPALPATACRLTRSQASQST
jgi:hypothetical protein